MQKITAELLKSVMQDQHGGLEVLKNSYYWRSIASQLLALNENKEIIVLTGVRRCGKSVLLSHIRQNQTQQDFYFNFEDDRLAAFEVSDFQVLYESFVELYGPQTIFYFDEIQNIPGWEKFVRRLYNNGYKIYITGSNANLFSEELGTHLTGRYISKSIYPFSFLELVHEKLPEVLES